MLLWTNVAVELTSSLTIYRRTFLVNLEHHNVFLLTNEGAMFFNMPRWPFGKFLLAVRKVRYYRFLHFCLLLLTFSILGPNYYVIFKKYLLLKLVTISVWLFCRVIWQPIVVVILSKKYWLFISQNCRAKTWNSLRSVKKCLLLLSIIVIFFEKSWPKKTKTLFP